MEVQSRIGPAEIEEAIQRIVSHIVEIIPTADKLVIAGIANGGLALGEILTQRLSAHYGVEIPHGELNITFQRDDLGQNPIPDEKMRTHLPVSIDGCTVILTDDVIFTGRSTRAALAELFDMGRPECVRLAILFDRRGRRLPVQPDVTGFMQAVDASKRVDVALYPEQPEQNVITIKPL